MSEETQQSPDIPGIEVTESKEYHLLPVDDRARLALASSKTEADLIALAAKHQCITEIKDKAGREQAHGAAMELMRARTTIANVSKAAREDATKFSRAVIAEEARLIALIEAEEKRLKDLRDAWDKEQERIKAEKAEAERKRLLEIAGRINEIKGYAALAQQCRTSSAVQGLVDRLKAAWVGCNFEDDFQEFCDEAQRTYDVTMATVEGVLRSKQAAEAEAKRLADERAEQERVRLEQEERQRELDARAAELERQRKELEAATAAAQAAAAPTPPPPVEPSTASNTSPVSESGIQAADAAILNATAATLVLATETTVIPLTQGTGPAAQVAMQEHITGVSHAFTTSPVVDPKPATVVDKPAVRPTDFEIVDAVAVRFDVAHELVIEWLQDMRFEIVKKTIAGEFA